MSKFMVNSLNMPPEQAATLHQQYLREFGSTIEGLMHYHQVDPMSFNKHVDDALPLEDLLDEDIKLQQTLAHFDKTKVKLWLLTNAHITHARRVVRILGVEQYFEGITFCDYASGKLVLKPSQKMYAVAERNADVGDVRQCFLVDNSVQNCVAAQNRGWTVVHLCESSQELAAGEDAAHRIRSLHELPSLFPAFT
jgi:pyrimidine and pyridine-specific 5'-nucleotidase